MDALEEAVKINQVHNRDPIGGSNENLFVWVLHVLLHVQNRRLGNSYLLIFVQTIRRPLLKLLDKLLLVGVVIDEDLDRLLVLIDPNTWDPEKVKCMFYKAASSVVW
jgi:ryanodine receptor 2